MARATTRPTQASKTPPRFFALIPPNPGIDFVRLAPIMMGISAVAVAVSVALLVTRGLTYGIDFAGGTMVQARFPERTSTADVRGALEQAGVGGASVQDVGAEGREFQVRVGRIEEGEAETASNAVRAALQARFGEGSYEVIRVETVGPKVGRDLWRNAALAVLASTVLMGIYIAIRFDLRFALGAAVALVHDVLITLGALVISGIEVDLTTVAALLTIVGFSVNDTVVISDRIRENQQRRRGDGLAKIINDSINETLSRTIITSGTAILTVVALFVLGGDVIHSFAFALLVGFLAGVYSTVYVAAPLVLWMERWFRRPASARAK
jgi:preprotein translocase subunit SecF